jgi:hypothetical protein
MGDSGGGNVACDEAETTGNGAVDGWDDTALPVAGCPQTGQNQDPGCTECPHAGLLEPATPAIVTQARPRVRARQPERDDCCLIASHYYHAPAGRLLGQAASIGYQGLPRHVVGRR